MRVSPLTKQGSGADSKSAMITATMCASSPKSSSPPSFPAPSSSTLQRAQRVGDSRDPQYKSKRRVDSGIQKARRRGREIQNVLQEAMQAISPTLLKRVATGRSQARPPGPLSASTRWREANLGSFAKCEATRARVRIYQRQSRLGGQEVSPDLAEAGPLGFLEPRQP